MPRSMLILSKKSKSLNFLPDPVKSDINIRKNIFYNFKSLLFLSEEYLKYLFVVWYYNNMLIKSILFNFIFYFSIFSLGYSFSAFSNFREAY